MRSVKNTSKLTSFIFAQIETPTYVKCDILCVYYLKFLYRERTANPSNIFIDPASASQVCILPEVVAISAIKTCNTIFSDNKVKLHKILNQILLLTFCKRSFFVLCRCSFTDTFELISVEWLSIENWVDICIL